jgi:phage terminase large subunit-like protein
LVLRNPDLRIGWVQYSAVEAKKSGRELRQMMEMGVPRLIGGPFWRNPGKEAPKWTENELQVRRQSTAKEATWTFFGIEDLPTGSHFDIIIGDDIVVPQNVTTPDQIGKTKEQFSLLTMLLDSPERNPMVFGGTRYHYEDVYGDIETQIKQKKWAGLKQPCYYPSGEPIFPSMFSKEGLESIRQDPTVGRLAFASQYLLDPVPTENQRFRAEWFQREGFYYKDAPEGLAWFMMIDPAVEVKDESDYTAINVVGIDSNCNYWREVSIRGHWDPGQITDKVFELHKKYPIQRTAIEVNGFQKYLKWWLEKEEAVRKTWFAIQEVKHVGGKDGNSKAARILSLQPLYETGKVHHHETLRGSDSELELLQYPFSMHDDTSDCFAMIKDIEWMPGKHERALNPEPERMKSPTSMMDKYFGPAKDRADKIRSLFR